MDSRETQCAAQEPLPPRPPRTRTPATSNQRDALLAAAPPAQHSQPQPPAEDGNEDEQPPAEDLEDQRLDDATTAAAAAASASSSRLRVTGTGSSASATNAQLLANGSAQNAMGKQRQPDMEGEQGGAEATRVSSSRASGHNPRKEEKVAMERLSRCWASATAKFRHQMTVIGISFRCKDLRGSSVGK
ncbi:Hypothetical Protein FCC1311_024892 [Hondaea fermentalgiana]|uniref:Uncharacterized protein n=1 Tax=Hondaea fermentalgiana TaxID=2315210 RepID=A0A2R5G916_9STRA|nr:Hypothetical Protein FCC1311_024892 [Hondaea fermentalgiana]|eukprot:GBG26268.1 Hypothetical Protein FCC1311_024892 [Hondaea fermentalgiana]